jgi:hypothetical protein
MASVTQNIKRSLGMSMALNHQALAVDVVRVTQCFDQHMRMISCGRGTATGLAGFGKYR